jgi:hypothetical protein
MNDARQARKTIRCAIYTRKSTEEGLEQDFNSLDAQREACAAYVLSQKHEGWTALPPGKPVALRQAQAADRRRTRLSAVSRSSSRRGRSITIRAIEN